MRFQGYEEFQISAMHGRNAFTLLKESIHLDHMYKKNMSALSEMDEKETHSKGFRHLTENSRLERDVFNKLCSCVVLYQASMEAVFSNVLGYSEKVRSSFREEGFYKDWKRALKTFGQPIKEIQAYRNDFYNKLRNNLVHLYPDTDQRLEEVNNISIGRVYSGIRYGWWAHSRLWIGSERVTTSCDESWKIICRQQGLISDLFPDTHPDKLPPVS